MSESNIAYVFRVTFYTQTKEKASSVYFLNAEDTRFALDIDVDYSALGSSARQGHESTD